jgi:hypothetical protein
MRSANAPSERTGGSAGDRQRGGSPPGAWSAPSRRFSRAASRTRRRGERRPSMVPGATWRTSDHCLDDAAGFVPPGPRWQRASMTGDRWQTPTASVRTRTSRAAGGRRSGLLDSSGRRRAHHRRLHRALLSERCAAFHRIGAIAGAQNSGRQRGTGKVSASTTPRAPCRY